MIKRLFNKIWPQVATPVEEEYRPLPDRLAPHDVMDNDGLEGVTTGDYIARAIALAPDVPTPMRGELMDGAGMDETDGSGDTPEFKQRMARNAGVVSDVLALWYSSQSFIGHQLAALVAQHWLVDKACSMPAKDAIRKGYTIGSLDGDDIPQEVTMLLDRADRRYNLRRNMLEFIHLGRVFGVRIAIFKVRGVDYTAPFNLDGVTPGSYEGIVQIDPYWCAPQLDADAASKPDSMHFYEPTYWQINGQRYHRSHLIIFRNGMLPDILKPMYQYGGVPVPQQVMERIYGAERTANEAPLLALTKRTTVYKTDTAKALMNWPVFKSKIQKWARFWSNNGMRIIDNTEEVEQVDTSLADLDAVIMTQYQLVAAASGVPATKLIGTSPKGFGASGEYEESSYHEFLESIQEHDLTPFVNRHHQIALRSFVAPKIPEAVKMHTTVVWEPLDTMTAKEKADVELVQAQAGAALVTSGAIDGVDERNRLIADKDSPYINLPPVERGDQLEPVSNDGAQ